MRKVLVTYSLEYILAAEMRLRVGLIAACRTRARMKYGARDYPGYFSRHDL